MTKQFRQTLILFAILLLTSCGESGQVVKKEEEAMSKKIKEEEAISKQKKENIIMKNEEEIIKLSKKYNSVIGWDTVRRYTYVYQEMFIDQGKLISFDGELQDITKLDSTYYLSVYKTVLGKTVWDEFKYISYTIGRHYIAEISLNSQKFVEFRKASQSINTTYGCYIFKVSQIISKLPSMKPIDDDDDDAITYSFELAEPELIFKGELIDYIYLKE